MPWFSFFRRVSGCAPALRLTRITLDPLEIRQLVWIVLLATGASGCGEKRGLWYVPAPVTSSRAAPSASSLPGPPTVPVAEHPPRVEGLAEPLEVSTTLKRHAAPEAALAVSPGKHSVRGVAGMVVSVNADATRIGVEILKSGGNAADAAVGVALALAVTHPSAGNLGGGGFALVRSREGKTLALDFRESSPAQHDRERFNAMVRHGEGPDSVAVPGTVAGLVELSQRFGRYPFSQVVEPARQLAATGHIVSAREAVAIRTAWRAIKRTRLGLARYGNGARQPLAAGMRLVLPELASTLAKLQSDGLAGFYDGEVAASIVASLGSNPLLLTSDLLSYRAIWREPLEVMYRGLRVLIMPPPSAGGVALASSLLMLSAYDPQRLARGSPAHAHLLLEIMRRAQSDRAFAVVDPDTLSDVERESTLSSLLDQGRWRARCPINPIHATPNSLVTNWGTSTEAEHTTHLAVVDASGMAVSLTTTLSSGFGSKLITDTGIVLNNSLASFSGMGKNQPGPNQRTTSSMSPTLVEDQTGLKLVLGTPGGDTIPSTLLQIISAIVDYHLPLDEAVDAPRLHQSIHGRGNARMESSRPIPKALEVALTRMGHEFVSRTGVFGHANSIAIVDDVAFGYVDPREGGLALAAPPAQVAETH